MKKAQAVILLIIMMMCSVADAAYYPSQTQNTSSAEKTKAINVVVNNLIDIEDALADFLVLTSVMENTDFYFYTLTGDMPALKLENNTECVQNIMKNYTKKKDASKMSETPGYITAVNDLAALDYPEKEVYVFWDNMGELESDAVKKAYFDYVKSTSGMKIKGICYQDHWHREAELVNPDYVNIKKLDLPTILEENGYTEIPGSYYHYDKSAGTVTINEGRADANILVYAEASKEDYLYISGYMATKSLYESTKKKDTVKGASLGYNAINLEKTPAPRNVAWQLFSIDESLYDVNTNAFVIPVKNAEYVSLYYNSEQGSGACSKETKYKRSQDDKITNRYAPVETETNETVVRQIEKNSEGSSHLSLLGKEDAETGNVFVRILKAVLKFILNLLMGILGFILALLRFLFPVTIIAMLVSKNIRHNIITWVMKSKLGPFVKFVTLKVMQLWAALTKQEKPEHVNLEETIDNVFLSHSSKDRLLPENYVEKVMAELDERGIKYWISSKKLKSGDKFGSKINFAVKDCSVFVLFVSQQSLSSPDVKNEMALANKYKKKILPVRIEDFDIMKDPDWEYWFMNCQVEDALTNSEAEVKNFVNIVEKTYNEKKG